MDIKITDLFIAAFDDMVLGEPLELIFLPQPPSPPANVALTIVASNGPVINPAYLGREPDALRQTG